MMTYGIPGTRVVAYTYDADHHCTDCAEERFGTDDDGYIPEDAEDSEANPIHAVFVTDLDGRTVERCADCEGIICLACGDIATTRRLGRRCWNCRTAWDIGEG